MKIRFVLPENYSQHQIVYVRNVNVFVFSRIQGLLIFASILSDFVDRPAWLESPISHSVNSDLQIHFIYSTSHTVLMLTIFITPCILNSMVSYGRSKQVTRFDGSGRSDFWEDRNVDISISSKKIRLCSLGIISNTVLFIFEIEIVLFSFISRDDISLEAPCQIFADRPAFGPTLTLPVPGKWKNKKYKNYKKCKKTGQAAIEPRTSSLPDKIWYQVPRGDGCPTVLNHLTRPLRPSITKFTNFIQFSHFTCWRLPDGYPTVLNHLTGPQRPSMTKITKII
jgi:hypothetical protein